MHHTHETQDSQSAVADPVALASQVNDHHLKATAAANDALQHARQAGLLLIEAKEQIGHGGFLEWVKVHCQFSDRMARRYMVIAARWSELANRPRVSDLSLRAGLKLLDKPKDGTDADSNSDWRGKNYTPFLQLSVERRRHLVTTWPDIRISRTLLFDADTWSVEQIAEMMGIPEIDIDAILAFCTPTIQLLCGAVQSPTFAPHFESKRIPKPQGRMT